MSDPFAPDEMAQHRTMRAVADLPKHVRKAIWDGYWRATARIVETVHG
jgi:hypothetical protein